MLDIIVRILRDYPETLENMHRVNAILLDLAPDLPRERILVRSFVELDGTTALRNAEAYPLEEKKLVQGMIDTFSMEKTAALWAVRLFGVAMGLIGEENLLSLSADDEQATGKPVQRVSASYLHGQVSIGKKHVAAVGADGTVFSGGDNTDFQCDTSGWHDIVAVATGEAHTLGLRADGIVLATGANAFDECDVGHLTGVKAVYAFGYDSVCVLADGTAEAVGRSKWDLSTFSDIVGIAKYPEGLIGVKSDGTLSLVGYITEDDAAQEIAWLLSCHDVKQVISTYNSGSIILGKDGRIYKSNMPENYFTQWRDIKSIVDLADSFAVLRTDGTVRVLSYERDKPRPDTEADKWTNISAIFGGYKRLLGLTKDGNLRIAYTHQGWLWANASMKMDYVSNWYPVGACE